MGFHKWGYPKWMVYKGKSIYKWMIWGYRYFGKPPNEYTVQLLLQSINSVDVAIMQCLKPTRIWGYRGKFMETQWKYDGSFPSIYVDFIWKDYDNI